MSGFYYLISSLPMLKYRVEPDITLEEFLSVCSSFASEKDCGLIEKCSLIPENKIDNKTLGKFYNWEIQLRNRIAEKRISRTDSEMRSVKREHNDFSVEIDDIIQKAESASNPAEKEKVLDEARWNKLEELESGHDFDLDALLLYKIKLLINLKWTARIREKGKENFRNIIDDMMEGLELNSA